MKSSVEVEQVFAVSAEVNGMYRIKPGWINKQAGSVLEATKNDIKSLTEAFVVKIISNTVFILNLLFTLIVPLSYVLVT